MIETTVPPGFIRMSALDAQALGRSMADAVWLLSLTRADIQDDDIDDRTTARLTEVINALRDLGRGFVAAGEAALDENPA